MMIVSTYPYYHTHTQISTKDILGGDEKIVTINLAYAYMWAATHYFFLYLTKASSEAPLDTGYESAFTQTHTVHT